MTVAAFQGLLAGRFIIEREVGRGGVGIVYRAMDEVTGAPVALKVIAIHGVDAGEEARFGREGRVLAGLSHPNIVRVVAFGQLDEGQPYVAMEWLDGEDIAQRQKRAPLTLGQAVVVVSVVLGVTGSLFLDGSVRGEAPTSTGACDCSPGISGVRGSSSCGGPPGGRPDSVRTGVPFLQNTARLSQCLWVVAGRRPGAWRLGEKPAPVC
ncbi:MAG TPA: protein kinase [Labilithrix sp.]|nr:protein kinase [Labilithrix sp.]